MKQYIFLLRMKSEISKFIPARRRFQNIKNTSQMKIGRGKWVCRTVNSRLLNYRRMTTDFFAPHKAPLWRWAFRKVEIPTELSRRNKKDGKARAEKIVCVFTVHFAVSRSEIKQMGTDFVLNCVVSYAHFDPLWKLGFPGSLRVSVFTYENLCIKRELESLELTDVF